MTIVAVAKTPGSSALGSALAFLQQTAELAADQTHPLDAGCVVRSPSLPLVWGLNHVRVSGPATYEQATRLAEEHLGDLPYRQLVIQHEHSAQQLEQALSADAWKPDVELLMVLARPPEVQADTAAVVEVSEDEASELMRRWLSEDPKMTTETLDQVVAATNREADVRHARHLGLRDETGALVAMTRLYSDGITAQVEDVYTVPAWRNRGCARRLVTRAVALAHEAPHQLVFIVADDRGWPKHLYTRLGFDPIGRMGVFHRDG